MGTFTGARRYVLHTFATTQSAADEEARGAFMIGADCPVCHGKRLQARVAVGHVRRPGHRRAAHMSLSQSPSAAAAGDASRTQTRPRRGRAAPRRVRHGAARRRRRLGARRRARRAAHADLSEEKRIAAQRIADDMFARIATLERSASAICRSIAARRPCRRASCSGCAWRRRSAPTSSASSMSSTSLPRACIRPTARRCWRRSTPQARGQFALRRRARSGRSMRRADWIVDVGPDAGEHGGQILYSGPPAGLQRSRRRRRARYLFARRRRRAAHAARAARLAAPRRRHAQQPARPRRRVSARRAHDRHRRLGLGQVEPREPGAGRARVPRSSATSRRRRRRREPPTASRPSPRRPAAASPAAWSASAARARRPEADRPHAALEPRDLHRPLRPRAQALRRDAGGARAPLRRGPLLVQRRQGPLRDLRRRRLRHASSCSSCRASMRPARPATARATTRRRLR